LTGGFQISCHAVTVITVVQNDILTQYDTTVNNVACFCTFHDEPNHGIKVSRSLSELEEGNQNDLILRAQI
jgi:hypothetical protein